MPKDHGGSSAEPGGAAPAVSGGVAPGKRPRISLAFPPRDGAANDASDGAGLDLTLHAPASISERIDEFRVALDRGDREAAEWAWMRATEEERRAWGASSSIGRELTVAHRVLGLGLVSTMAQAGVDFAGRDTLVAQIFAGPQLGQYVDAMVHQDWSLAFSFLHHVPPAHELTAAHRHALGRILRGANELDAARWAFGRLYGGTALDSYPRSELAHSRAWTHDSLVRVHALLASHPAPGHIRTIAGWHIVYEHKEKATDAAFKPLDYAWYSGGHVVLPEASLSTGGGSTHSSVGGSNAHTDPGQEWSERAGTMTHLENSVLHEIGHGIGDKLGGNTWTRSHAFVDWKTNMDAEEWSKQLWGDDDTLTQRATDKLGGPVDGMPTAGEIRTLLVSRLTGAAPPALLWRPERVAQVIESCYGDLPLTRYVETTLKAREESFRFPGTQNVGSDGRVYVWLSRGGSGLSSYTRDAHQQKVSWYSLSSPNEWFAENYTAYYHFQPRGTGLDPGTKAKLDELHRQSPPPVEEPELLRPDFSEGGTPAATAAEDRVPLPW